jgi:outer membrane protein TolC
MLKSVLKVEKRNQYWPSFYLSVNYQQQAQENNFEFDKYFWGEGLSAGISVVIPLFDGFKTHSRVQMAKVELKKFELTRGQVEDGIRMEVKTSAWKLNEAWDKLQASRKSVEQAEKGYAIAEVRYQNGISTQVELLDARLAETQAKISELSARYDLIVAKASLERAKGN